MSDFERQQPTFRLAATHRGDTMQAVAARELGDANRWPELVWLNQLRPPYLTDDPGQASAGVILNGALLKIPSPRGVLTEDADEGQVYERDCFMVNRLLIDDGYGDIAIVAGTDNLCQQLTHRLNTPRGQATRHPDYGCLVWSLLGKVNGPMAGALGSRYVKAALLADYRVASVTSAVAQVSGDSVKMTAIAEAIAGGSVDRIGDNYLPDLPDRPTEADPEADPTTPTVFAVGGFVQQAQSFDSAGSPVIRAAGDFTQADESFDAAASPVISGAGGFAQPAQSLDAAGTPVVSGSADFVQPMQSFDGEGAPVEDFYFDQIANIRDFGIRNLANMRTVAGGGTLPVNNGDTVGEWRGELGNVVLQESSATRRPKLGAEGVSFQAASGTKRMRSSSGISRSATLACTVFVIQDLTASGYTDFISGNLRTSGTIQHGFTDAASGTNVTTNCREQSAGVVVPSGTLNSGRHCFAYVFDGSTGCNIWADSTKVNRPSIGTGSGTSDILELTNSGAQDGTVVAWGVVYGAISDADWAKIVALAPTL